MFSFRAKPVAEWLTGPNYKIAYAGGGEIRLTLGAPSRSSPRLC